MNFFTSKITVKCLRLAGMFISYTESQLFKVSVGGLNDVEVLQNFKESAAKSRAIQSQIKSIKKKLYEVESNFRTKS